MYKKDKFKKLDAIYSTHLYTGLLGFIMRYCHRQLENFNRKKKYSKILEIGAGSEPHLNYLKHDYDEYFIAETSSYALESYKKMEKIKACYYNGKNLPFENNFFDRIIISHCLEHINEPEKFLFEMMSKLKNGGVLSISLPTDPGLLWRLGRLFIRYFIVKKTYMVSRAEYEYINATEHINSIFTLVNLIRYNFKNQIEECCLPLRIKLLDINLFYNVHITKFGN
jgi:SAM-dependent methyltransferase|tara:strand:+ start:1870 stop:2544 length:675 start_codon:yes stop_codon:yes gene_type:complete